MNWGFFDIQYIIYGTVVLSEIYILLKIKLE